MSLIELSVKSLADLKGGLVDRMLAAALNKVAIDLRAAPDVPEFRKVQLEIRCKPIVDDGELSDVIVEFAVGSKLPPRVTSSRMSVRSAANGAKQLFFAVDDPEESDRGATDGERQSPRAK